MHIWLVPLISDSPSFACSFTGFRLFSISASDVGYSFQPDLSLTKQLPSPIKPKAICDNGARSPDAPNEPILGMIGAIPRLIMSISNLTTSGRIPETPLDSEFARYTIIKSTCSGSIFSPTPQAWLRIRLVCNFANSVSSILTEDIAPNPVFIP